MLRARLACLALLRAHLLDARLMRRTLIALLALGTLLVRLLAWLLARLLARTATRLIDAWLDRTRLGARGRGLETPRLLGAAPRLLGGAARRRE